MLNYWRVTKTDIYLLSNAFLENYNKARLNYSDAVEKGHLPELFWRKIFLFLMGVVKYLLSIVLIHLDYI